MQNHYTQGKAYEGLIGSFNSFLGILANDIGKKIIMHFQNLGDNGMYQQFYVEQIKLLQGLKLLEEKFGEDYYKDLRLSVELEESIILFGQNKLDECENTAMRVFERSMNSPNGRFLMAKAHYIISAVFRQRGVFKRGEEHMEISTELLEAVEVCEETAVNQYNWAALLAEMSAKAPLSICEKEEAEYRFENTQLHWRNQAQNNTNRCPMRTRTREINYHLKTSRQRCPDMSQQVSEKALAKASRAIDYVELNLLNDCSKRHRVTFFIAKSDYHIRRTSMNGSVYTAEVIKGDAKTALAIAIELNLFKEIEGIEDRLRNINLLMETNWQSQNQPHSSRAIVPVEREDESIDGLLEELARRSLELTTD
ncbi:uncharacterized protein LOC116307198 isoform X2 [Actinia tenebrosa]|uniref:Uncharacterized protein LOC116307198 isoform X2 n=1 Tax=Actinia tenebrosa TaxID=6105 RepID=A0A6P8J144_ACTTE|nr:uncharacterized protein LOC116307198 isoform X2 [Actinia tenebrosa]